MKLIIKIQIQYPDTPPQPERSYGTRNINDTYEQTIEVEGEAAAHEITTKVIKAFNNF